MRHVRFLFMAVGLALIAPPAARAQVTYKIQSIAKLGDTVAGVKTKSQENSGAPGETYEVAHDHSQKLKLRPVVTVRASGYAPISTPRFELETDWALTSGSNPEYFVLVHRFAPVT